MSTVKSPLRDKLNFFGEESSEDIVVSWGSPKGAIIEALAMLKKEKYGLGFLQCAYAKPAPCGLCKEGFGRKE